MGSVRDRITAEQYAESEKRAAEQGRRERAFEAARDADTVIRPVSVNSTTRQAGTGMSVRERGERQRTLQSEEKLTPIDPHRATGLTSAPSFNTRVRDRITAQRDQAEVAVAPPTVSSIGAEWAEANRQSEARLERMQAESDREMAERVRRNNERAEYNKRLVPILLAFDAAPGGSATPEERKTVLEAAQRKFGGLPTPEWALKTLLLVRGAV